MSRSRALVLFFSLCFTRVLGAQVLELPRDPASLACTEGQLAAWQAAMDDSLGVAAGDPWHEDIGGVAAIKSSAIVPTWAEYLLNVFFLGGAPSTLAGRQLNWIPITGHKHTMCGTLMKYEFFPNQAADREEDSTLYLRPTAPGFLQLFDVGRREASEVEDCEGGTDDCMEAEITLPPRARGTAEFPTHNDSVLEGGRLCTFGPYVSEFVHGRHPEIHPAQGLWWNAPPDAGSIRAPLILLGAKDDSGRYDSRDDFTALGVGAPDGWVPWASSPVTTRFRVAVSARPDVDSPSIVWVLNQDDQNVSASQDPGLGARGPLELQTEGRSILKVTDLDERKAGIGLEDVCWSGTQWLGFLRISTAVGTSGSGDAGFHRMMVYFSESRPTPPSIATLAKTRLAPLVDPKTIRVSADGVSGEVSVVATMEAQSPPALSLQDVGAEPRPLSWTGKGKGQWEAALGSRPLGSPVVLGGPRHERMMLDLPSARFVAKATAIPLTLGRAPARPASWPFDVAQLPAEISRVEVTDWAVLAMAEAFPLLQDGLKPEEGGGIAEVLNRTLLDCLKAAGPEAEPCSRLGPQLPVRVAWALDARGQAAKASGEAKASPERRRAWLSDAVLRISRRAPANTPPATFSAIATLTTHDGRSEQATVEIPGEILVAKSPAALAAGLRAVLASRPLTIRQRARLDMAAGDGWVDPAELRAALGP